MSTIAVTGANGFIARNLIVTLKEAKHNVVPVPRDCSDDALVDLLRPVDAVVHLAGVNRPTDESEFVTGNVDASERLVKALTEIGKRTPVIYSSSIQAELDNPYGKSKRAAEEAIARYGQNTGAAAIVMRLPNVFGKWSRPNYNSVVSTFCHNIAHGLPIAINDPGRLLRLVYVDDVVAKIISMLGDLDSAASDPDVRPVYEVTLGDLAKQIERFRDSRADLVTGNVGTGLLRALHATYLSYLDPKDFAYPLVAHTDPRGSFVEMLRTPESGQFSYFTAHPGITRGGHYHHSKTEKFLVLQGTARFGFRHIVTDETFQIVTTGSEPKVVETVPGWSHDITNVGDDTLIVMLWANEIFDREKPDTFAAKVLDA